MADTIINLSTAGTTLSYAVETTAGTRPTKGYTIIPGVKSTPATNVSPETLDTTDLAETEYKTYIDGLKDLGGALEFTANMTEVLMSKWEALMTSYETAKSSGKSIWFCIATKGLSKAVYFKGNPSPLGMPETSVGAVLENTLYITPTNAPDWFEKPTTE